MNARKTQAEQRELRLRNRRKSKAISEIERQGLQQQAERQIAAGSRNTTRQADVTTQEDITISRTPVNAYEFLLLPLPEFQPSLEKKVQRSHHLSSPLNALYNMDYEQVDFPSPSFEEYLGECRSRLEKVHLELLANTSLRSVNNESDVAHLCMVHAISPVAQIAMDYVDDLRIKALGELQLTPYLSTILGNTPGWGYPDAAFCFHLPNSSTDGLPPLNKLYPLIMEFKDRGSLPSRLNRGTWSYEPFRRTREQVAKYLSHHSASFAVLTDYESWYIFQKLAVGQSCFLVDRKDARKAVFWAFVQSFQISQASLLSSTANLELPSSYSIDQWIDRYLKPWISARTRTGQPETTNQRRTRRSMSLRRFVSSDGDIVRLRDIWHATPQIRVTQPELPGSDIPLTENESIRGEQSQFTSQLLPSSNHGQQPSRQADDEPNIPGDESTRPSTDVDRGSQPQLPESEGPSIEVGRNRTDRSLQTSDLQPLSDFRQQSSRQTVPESNPRVFELMLTRRPFPREIADYLGKGAGIRDGVWLPLDQIARLSTWDEFAPDERPLSLVVECQVPNRSSWPHVVLKIAKRGVLDLEVAAYEKLLELQGDVIPYFLGRYPIDDERHECIMLEKIQETQDLLAICQNEASTLAYLDQYWPRFLSLIALGVRHNDLIPQNVLHTSVGPVIVDLQFATTCAWSANEPQPFSDSAERRTASYDIETFMSTFYRSFEQTELWEQALDHYITKAFQTFRDSIDQGHLPRPDIETILQSVPRQLSDEDTYLSE